MSKQLNFKQFSTQFKWNTGLNVKTVLLQAAQFSISTQFSSIWPIDMTLSGATRVDLGAMAMKGYSIFPKGPVLLKPNHQIV